MQSLFAPLSSTGNAKAAPFPGGIVGRPKTKERAKGKGKKTTRPGLNARTLENSIPIAQHPIPVFLRIQPGHRLAHRSAGLMKTGIFFDGESQVGSVRFVFRLSNARSFFSVKGQFSA